MKDKFVPVVMNGSLNGTGLRFGMSCGKHHPDDDKLWETFGSFEDKSHFTPTRWCVTASGRAVVSEKTEKLKNLQLGADGNQALPALLEAFAQLPEADRRPADVKAAKPDLSLLCYKHEPPAGGLVLRQYNRFLMKDAKTGYRPARYSHNDPALLWEWEPGYQDIVRGGPGIPEPGHKDNVWVTEAEWKALLPASPKKGDRLPVPAALCRRLARFGFRGYNFIETGALGWPADAVRQCDLSVRVEEVSPETVSLRLEGPFHLKTDKLNGEDGRRAEYQGRFSGVLRYDLGKKAFRRFDLVALGDYQGFKFWKDTSGAILGFAFELAKGDLAGDGAQPMALFRVKREEYLSEDKGTAPAK
jgi:hypothetical protein